MTTASISTETSLDTPVPAHDFSEGFKAYCLPPSEPYQRSVTDNRYVTVELTGRPLELRLTQNYLNNEPGVRDRVLDRIARMTNQSFGRINYETAIALMAPFIAPGAEGRTERRNRIPSWHYQDAMMAGDNALDGLEPSAKLGLLRLMKAHLGEYMSFGKSFQISAGILPAYEAYTASLGNAISIAKAEPDHQPTT